MDPVTHFELPAENSKRAAKFYSQVFGWEATHLGPEMGNYTLVTTTETDDQRMVKVPGTINGGIYQKTEPTQQTRISISVNDINEAKRKIEESGGRFIGGIQKSGEPDEIPGVGLYATFIDTEGNYASVLQPFSNDNKQ